MDDADAVDARARVRGAYTDDARGDCTESLAIGDRGASTVFDGRPRLRLPSSTSVGAKLPTVFVPPTSRQSDIGSSAVDTCLRFERVAGEARPSAVAMEADSINDPVFCAVSYTHLTLPTIRLV